MRDPEYFPRTLTRSPLLPGDPILPGEGTGAVRRFRAGVDPQECTNTMGKVFTKGKFGMLRSGKCLTVDDDLTQLSQVTS
eukprot:scaffold234317_cov44-Tisochrysis_lutea.AAC.1